MKVPGSGDILDYARRFGWRRAFSRGTYVAANQVTTVSIFECFRLGCEDVNTTLAASNDGFECRFMSVDEAAHLARPDVRGSDLRMAQTLDEARAHGDDIYVILDRGRLVSIGLYAATPTPILDDLVVHFEAPARYMYRGYTIDEYRGRRLHALGILRAALELFDQGVPQLVTVCEKTNYPATVSVHRMGWQTCGALYRVRVGAATRLGRTSKARKMGMDLRLRDRERSGA